MYQETGSIKFDQLYIKTLTFIIINIYNTKYIS
jgi:hypothetical protein